MTKGVGKVYGYSTTLPWGFFCQSGTWFQMWLMRLAGCQQNFSKQELQLSLLTFFLHVLHMWMLYGITDQEPTKTGLPHRIESNHYHIISFYYVANVIYNYPCGQWTILLSPFIYLFKYHGNNGKKKVIWRLVTCAWEHLK